MAILPTPTIPDPEPPAHLLPRIMEAINALAVLRPVERERLMRDPRLEFGHHIEHHSRRELERMEFMRYLVRCGVYSDDIAA